MPNLPFHVFVATKLPDVPAGCARYVSVDGSVPGAAVRWDHHVTGERINLDAMPDELDLDGFDGIGTTLADADAVASVVAAAFGGRGRLAAEVRATLESASHWCDHLAPHPDHGDEPNRLGRGLCDFIGTRFSTTAPADISGVFARTCREVVACIAEGRPLPYADNAEGQRKLAARLLAEGRVRGSAHVALVDLRGFPSITPAACYELHACPVAVAVDDHPRGGAKYTVGVNPRVATAPTDLGSALRALARAEFSHGAPALGPDPIPGQENWGGRATVFGSPWNYGSRLAPELVVAVGEGALGWSVGHGQG
jgi:hypothetical protein